MFSFLEKSIVSWTCGHRRRHHCRPWKGGTSSRKQHGGLSFLGLASYYRRFIPDFSTVAQPLYKLTEAKTEFVWTGQCQQAFDSLKGLLTSARVLAYPTREGKFVIDIDASDHGIGAVLSQLQDGVERPFAFAKGTKLNFWQLFSLSSNTSITCKVPDSAFELIMPPCTRSLTARIQKDSWRVGLNS